MTWGLDRLQNIGSAALHVLDAPAGIVSDLAKAAVTDDGHDGVVATLKAIALHRSGQLLEDTIGPKGVGGQIIGGLPEPVREAGNAVNAADQWLYREGVSHPLGAAFSAMADPNASFGEKALAPLAGARWDLVSKHLGDKWAPDAMERAYRVSKHRSFGQSLYLGLVATDPYDEKASAAALDSTWGSITSGVFDTILSYYADPMQVAGSVVAEGRLAKKTVGGLAAVQAERTATYAAKAEAFASTKADTLARLDLARPVGEKGNLIDAIAANLEGLAARRSARGIGLSGAQKADLYLGSEIGKTFLDSVNKMAFQAYADTEAAHLGPIAAGGIGDIDKVAMKSKELLAGQIRDRFFSDDAWGDVASHLLANADTAESRELALRAMLGDSRAIDALTVSQADIASRAATMRLRLGEIDSLAGTFPSAAAFRDFAFNNTADLRPGMTAEIQQQLDWALKGGTVSQMRAATTRAVGAAADSIELPKAWLDMFFTDAGAGNAIDVINRAPQLTMRGELRQAITHAGWYQSGPMSRPVAMLFDKATPAFLQLDGVGADISFKRYIDSFGDVFNADEVAAYRGKFIATPDGLSRGLLADDVEAEAIRRLGGRYGVDQEATREILKAAQEGHGAARGMLLDPSSRRYAANGLDVHHFVGDDDFGYVIPLLETQGRNWRTTVNFKAVRGALEDWERQTQRAPAWASVFESPEAKNAAAKTSDLLLGVQKGARTVGNLTTEALDSIMAMWKPLVLLRPAWPVRMVLMDEQLRKLAKMHSLGELLDGLGAGGLNLRVAYAERAGLLSNVYDEAGNVIGRKMDAARAVRRGTVTGAAVGGILAGPAGAAAGAVAGGAYRAITAGMFDSSAAGTVAEKLIQAMSNFERSGYAEMTVHGYEMTGAFGQGAANANEINRAWQMLASSGRGMQENLAATETRWIRLVRQSGEFRSIAGHEPGYAQAVEHALNNQLGQDRLARQLLSGKSVEEVTDWAMKTPDGRAAIASVPIWRRVAPLHGRTWMEERVQAVSKMVEHYTMGSAGVKAAALEGKANVKMLESIVAESAGRVSGGAIDRGLLPVTHGESLAQVLGTSQIRNGVANFVDKSFKVLNQLPTDELSRNPYFESVYKAEVRRQLGNRIAGGAEGIAKDELRTIENGARRLALAETKRLLYDMGERSEFSVMIRHLLPFFPAQQEILTRWAGIAAENPAFAARAYHAYAALDHAVFTAKDTDGQPVVRFRLPQFAAGLLQHSVFSSAFDDQGYVSFDKKSLNMLTGGVGFGPVVQLAASEVAKANPSYEESLKLILPYGPVHGLESFLPSSMQKVVAMQHEDSGAYATAWGTIAVTRMTKMRQGLIAPVDFSDPTARGRFINDVTQEAKHLFALRAVAATISPGAPTFLSPYADYINAYRDLKKKAREAGKDPSAADTEFLAKYGDEFFPLTQQFSKTNNAVAPTAGGQQAFERHKDLIEANPRFGGLIVGSEGSELSQFSSAVYESQMSTPVTPGSSVMQRERLSKEEIVTRPDVRQGWAAYSKMADLIDAARIERGLPNLAVKAAEDLRQAKKLLTAKIAEDHPSWWQEFNQRDDLQAQRDRQSLRQIAADPTIGQRGDIAPLKDYFHMRDLMVQALSERVAAGGSGTLTASSNADLASVWDMLTGDLVASRVQFGPVYNRWLDRDVLTAADERGSS